MLEIKRLQICKEVAVNENKIVIFKFLGHKCVFYYYMKL